MSGAASIHECLLHARILFAGELERDRDTRLIGNVTDDQQPDDRTALPEHGDAGTHLTRDQRVRRVEHGRLADVCGLVERARLLVPEVIEQIRTEREDRRRVAAGIRDTDEGVAVDHGRFDQRVRRSGVAEASMLVLVVRAEELTEGVW
jgi:hypothetical protein